MGEQAATADTLSIVEAGGLDPNATCLTRHGFCPDAMGHTPASCAGVSTLGCAMLAR